jgi:hypothetical protein
LLARDHYDQPATPAMFDSGARFTYTLCLGSETGDLADGG